MRGCILIFVDWHFVGACLLLGLPSGLHVLCPGMVLVHFLVCLFLVC